MGRSRRYPLQSPWQSMLSQGHAFLWTPANGSTGTGTGFGMTWTVGAGVTVTTPTPSNGGPASINQMKRTSFADVVTTTNQEIGFHFGSSQDAIFWLGDASGLGGFYVSFRFQMKTWPVSGARLFAGI